MQMRTSLRNISLREKDDETIILLNSKLTKADKKTTSYGGYNQEMGQGITTQY